MDFLRLLVPGALLSAYFQLFIQRGKQRKFFGFIKGLLTESSYFLSINNS